MDDVRAIKLAQRIALLRLELEYNVDGDFDAALKRTMETLGLYDN